MSTDRLKALIAAYGADSDRWPEAERVAGARLGGQTPDAVLEDDLAEALTEARDIDALLAASPRPWPSPAARDRALASAVEAGLGGARARRRWTLGLAWLSGAGWAAATCAGLAAGVMLTTQMTQDLRADAVLYQASLFAVDDTEVLG